MLRYYDTDAEALADITRLLELEGQKKELDEEIKVLRGRLCEAVAYEQLAEPLECMGMYFSVGHRKTWKYSDAVKFLQDEVKATQAAERSDGTATLEKETEYLIVSKTGQPKW